MKKNIALMALTGVLTLASCGQIPTAAPDDKAEAPKNVVLNASPSVVASTGGAVTLSGSAADNVAVTKVVVSGGTTTLTCTVNGTTSVTYTCPTDNLPANTSTADKTYTYQATAYDAAGNSTLSNSVTVTVKGATTPPPAVTRTLTIDLVGVASAPITIKDASGTIVQGYNNIVVADSTAITGLIPGIYTVTGADANGAKAPAGNARVDLTGANGTAVLTYTANTQPIVGSLAITSPATGASFKVGDVVRVTFTATNMDASKGVTCSLGGTNTAAAVVSGNQGYCDLSVKNTTDLNIAVSGKDTAGNTISDARSIAVAPAPAASLAVSLSEDQRYVPQNCTSLPKPTPTSLDGWIEKADRGQADYPAGSRYYFVKGKVRVNLDNVAGDVQVQDVEAYYKSTQAKSAVQKLDVLKDEKGYYVMFDSSYGAQVSNGGVSHEGYPTQLWFRVKNVDLTAITVVPDNIAPEAINPEVDAVRRKNQNGQVWMAGEIQFSSANKAIEDRPLGSDGAVNAGFDYMCYYMVPEGAAIADAGGDNPVGLRAFADSIINNAKYISPAIRSAGNPVGSTTNPRYFGENFSTANVVQYKDPVTGEIKGWVPNPAAGANWQRIANGRYKVYTLTFDKLGNARPASDPYRVTIDNVGPSVALPTVPNVNLTADIVDDSPLPFPADAGFVSDYARIRVNFGAQTLAGYTRQPDGSYMREIVGSNGDQDANAAIGVEGNSNLPIAKSIVSCTFQDVNLFDVAAHAGVPAAPANSFTTYDPLTQNWYSRFDSNRWQDGEVFAKCNQRMVATYTDARDQLGNYTPAAPIAPGTDRTWNPFKITVDNIDPTIDITNPDMQGVLAAGRTYRPEAQVRDQISGVRNSFLFWDANKALVPAPRLGDTAYTGTVALMNPVEIMRADADKSSLGGIDFRLPSFDDQAMRPDKIGIRGLVIDKAGNATLRTKQYNYVSDGAGAFGNSTFRTGIYNATSFPINDAAKLMLENNRNRIAGLTAADTAANSARVGLSGDTTLEIDAQSVTSTYGTLEVPKVYGRFNSIDWQAIRNYMVTPAADRNSHAFEGDSTNGDLLNAVVPTYADSLTASNAGDPSYLATNTANRTNTDLRSDWNTIQAPWMTLQGITNTPDVNNRYKMTNALRNPLVTASSARYPENCNPTKSVLPYSATYCTKFSPFFDQMNAIFTAGDGDFIFTGRNIQK